MNLLSHYYFDSIKGNPYYNFGLLFPDLVGSIERNWKLERQEIKLESENEMWLIKGCHQHIKRDASFHNTEAFLNKTKYIRKELEQFGFEQSGTRLFFSAHILFELLLDKVIIEEDPNLLENFYDNLDLIDPNTLFPFLKKTIGPFAERFLPFFEQFKKGKYAYHYKTNEGIFLSLNKIQERAKQLPFPSTKFQDFESLIFQIQEELKNEKILSLIS